MSAKKKTREQRLAEVDSLFESVAKAFAKVRDVTREKRKGFGSGALKVNGKIFAMMSSKGQFVAKLPKQRVDQLVSSGRGERFVPGPGRIMKEWAAIEGRSGWVEFAREAYDFVKQLRR